MSQGLYVIDLQAHGLPEPANLQELWDIIEPRLMQEAEVNPKFVELAERVTGKFPSRDYNDAVVAARGLRSTTQKPFVYSASAVDVDGDSVTYSLKQAPSGVTINAATGQVNWAKPLDVKSSTTATITLEVEWCRELPVVPGVAGTAWL